MVANAERAEQAPLWTATALLPEKVDGSRNNFAIFIEGNWDTLNNFSRSTRLLREEEGGWKNSPMLDKLVDTVMETPSVVSMTPGLSEGVGSRDLRKARDTFRRIIVNAIFGPDDAQFQDYAKNFRRQNEQLRSKISHEGYDQRKNILVSLENLRRDYQKERKPLAEQIQVEKTELFSQFWDYLRRDYRNFFDFVEFLKDRKNPERNKIKLFLESVASTEGGQKDSKKKSMLEQITHEWTVKLLENPPSQIIVDFSKTLRNSPAEDWLRFVFTARDVKEVTEEDVVDLLIKSKSLNWPGELKDKFVEFVSGQYSLALGVLRLELSDFHPRDPQKPLRDIFPTGGRVVSAKRGRNYTNGTPSNEGTPAINISPTEQRYYRVGLIRNVDYRNKGSIIIPQERPEDISSFLRKMADKFAPSDQRLIRDFEKILESLRQSPYGYGVEKLKEMRVTVNAEQPIPLRSFNPRKRLGLKLEHPDATEIRFVFVIIDDTIAIGGIYTHSEYDKNFK